MQSTKTLIPKISRISKTPLTPYPINTLKNPHNTRTMSLFPRFPASEFAPVFRLLDDYDTHRANTRGNAVRGFQPKFDVREVKSAYELHGELPGLDRKDVNIEFSDPHTLVVSGRIDRESAYGSGSDKAEAKKVTVEDEQEDGGDGQITTTAGAGEIAKAQQGDESTYWVTERSHGEFHRSFSFPSRVDQDNVKASLKNGILSIVAPKATAQQARKVNID